MGLFRIAALNPPHHEDDVKERDREQQESKRVRGEDEEKTRNDGHGNHCEDVLVEWRRLAVVVVVTEGRACAYEFDWLMGR